MSEPFFVAQRAGHLTTPQIASETDAAKAEGATWFRVSLWQDPPLTLIEGWKDRPDAEGEPRWALQRV